MTPPRIALSIALAALAALVALGLGQLARSHNETPTLAKLTPAEMSARLSGSPAPLRALHTQADELLSGGGPALAQRLHALHGFPVVINKWASWCEPCRAEFGIFQRASVDLGRKVAFVGLDSGDSERGRALAFLRSFPVSYPSYYDPSGQLGEQITSSPFTPVTVFIAPDGSRYPHQGPYTSLSKLERDVERYAVDA